MDTAGERIACAGNAEFPRTAQADAMGITCHVSDDFGLRRSSAAFFGAQKQKRRKSAALQRLYSMCLRFRSSHSALSRPSTNRNIGVVFHSLKGGRGVLRETRKPVGKSS